MPAADLAALSTAVLAATFILAFAFGAIVQRTNFCTMGSIADVVNFGDWTRLRQWLLAIAVAISGTTLLDAAGLIDVRDSYYTTPRFAPLAYAVGGALFGFGMVLAGGCGSKSLVRAGGGSLKALVVLLVLAVVAYMTLRGALALVRVGLIERFSTILATRQDLGSLLARSDEGRSVWQLVLGVALPAVLAVFVLRERRFRTFDNLLAGIGIGTIIIAVWFVSGHIGHVLEHPQTLEDVFLRTNSRRMESLSFVAPVAWALDYLLFTTDTSKVLTIGIVAAVAIGAGLFARVIPAGFIPEEDQGIFGVNVQLPPGASLERTSLVLKKIEDILAKTDGLDSYQTVGGYGAVTSTYQPNYGTIFVRMKPWDERKSKELHVNGIMGALRPQLAAIPEAIIFPFNIPTLSGFGAASGFNFLLQDRSGSLTIAQLGELAQKFIAAARQRPELGTVFTSFDPNYPQIRVELDREKARTLGVPVNEVFQALSAALGGSYVNDFNRFGRLYRVYVQAEAAQRLKAEDIGKIYVRSKTTVEMIPLSTLVTIQEIAGAELTTRFNLQRSVEVQGAPAPGYTSGQALAALEAVFAETMPPEMGFAYSSMSYQESIAPPAAPTFIMAIVCVFLLLAALYESWRLPWAVLLGSPLVALGAFFGVWLMGYDNNVYVQIGLVMLIGLAAKNAILIVEFAKAKHEGGASLEEAALESARLRFRPILMTAFAFILGVVPLMLASGAGAGAQNVMGTGVFWGMLVATALGVFIIPGNYTFVEGLGRRGRKTQPAAPPAAAKEQGAE